jgi:hypothetical protein
LTLISEYEGSSHGSLPGDSEFDSHFRILYEGSSHGSLPGDSGQVSLTLISENEGSSHGSLPGDSEFDSHFRKWGFWPWFRPCR